MRIDRLELRNFRKYADATFESPRPAAGPGGSFHVLIGENGSGKTTVLDAAAVALGVWLERPPDASLANSRRGLKSSDKRLTARPEGDRVQFRREFGDLAVRATGVVLDHDPATWGPQLARDRMKSSNDRSRAVLKNIEAAYERIGRGEAVLLPVIAYYGAGRAWLASNQRAKAKATANPGGPANRWEAFYDCLNERVRVSDLAHWFQGEHIAMGNRRGRYRPGFEVVRRAILRCVPGGDGVWYDGDMAEVVLSIAGAAQPFSNLSAGQRTLLSVAADLAVRMVTQNNFLVPPDELGPDDDPLPRVLAQTPGVVLLDELDVHLHPTWQRRVCRDLKRTFPQVQFIGTTHSPQVVGGVESHELIRLLPDGTSDVPAQAYGMDANWILEVLMNADKEEPEIKKGIEGLFRLIAERRLDEANREVAGLRQRIGNSEDLQRAASTIDRIRVLGK